MKRFYLMTIVFCLAICFSSCGSVFRQTDSVENKLSCSLCEERSVRYSMVAKHCEHCLGTGYDLEICSYCNGTGAVKIPLSKKIFFRNALKKEDCVYCSGGTYECPSCGGRGTTYQACRECGEIKRSDCPDC